MHLHDLGWSTYFAQRFSEFPSPYYQAARIVRQEKNRYLIQGAFGTRLAVLAGRLRHETPAHLAVVGDWVAVHLPETGDLGLIEAILPRRSVFSRKEAGEVTREQVIAANIDTLFIVMGLDGDFNVRRAERYILQAWSSGSMPVIVLNKADLVGDIDPYVQKVREVALSTDVIAVSAVQEEGLDRLRRYVGTGNTVALVGSSGVGKSTILNSLLGSERMKTGAVREDDSRGRHTTTHRELFVLPGGGILIDTPGMRELQLWGTSEQVDASFAEIEVLARGCRFRDCTHRDEPGCAVQSALETGGLDQARYHSYQKLRRELEYLERRQEEHGGHEERRRGKKGARLIRQIQRRNPKR
jgi:ribosome biogenesis GTPase / thiamine phosphate phosphatase